MKNVLFIFMFLANFCNANDSTELYKKRIDKIKEIYEWIRKYPINELYTSSGDTNSKIWRIYDTAINVFFNRRYLDSIYKYRTHDDDIIPTDLKFRMLKGFIGSFHELTSKVAFDSLKFKMYDSPDDKSDISNEEASMERNFIYQYFILNGENYPYMGFFFRENSIQLHGIVAASFDESNLKFKTYYQNLKQRN